MDPGDALNRLSPEERRALAAWIRSSIRKNVFYPKTDLSIDLSELRRKKETLQDVNRDAISRLLKQEVLALELVPNAGTFHTLFRIQTASKRYFLKLSVEDHYSIGFPIEVWAMETLARLGLPSLQIPAFSASPDQWRVPFLFIEEATGQALNRFENPETQAMPEPLLFELGKTLAQIHQIEGEGAGLLGDFSTVKPKGVCSTWKEYIHVRLDEHLRECMQIRSITGMELSSIESHFADSEEIFASAPMRLLHGDPGHHNVFSDGEKITAIIDWEDALVGDPIFDIAYWGTFVRDEMRHRFLDGYSSVAPLPSDFERRYWLYYLRVAISKTVHRHKFGAKDRPGRPPASQRIQKALSKLAEL